MMQKDDAQIGAKIRNLRLRGNISLRKLARESGVSVSYLSSIEKNAASPTLATLRKVLVALGTNFFDFFNEQESNSDVFIFRMTGMRTVTDVDREYTFILPHRDDICLEMMDENYFASNSISEFETFEADFCGYVLSGEITLEIGDEIPAKLSGGDAFYVPTGTRVRGYCEKGKTARVISVLFPVDGKTIQSQTK